eukprot:1126295_1
MEKPKPHGTRKRNSSHLSEDHKPTRKRRKVHDNDYKWICTRCTLENDASATKCAICDIPQNYKEKDADTCRKNVVRKDTETPSETQYVECWVCTNCNAMNRLLYTHTKYNMACAMCRAATYTPSTPIIKSFDWDQQSFPTDTNTSSKQQTQAQLLGVYEIQKRNKYRTKEMKNKEGDLLIMGMIHQNNVRTLSTIYLVPEDVIRLTLLFHGELEYDGWDTFTNKEEFEIDNGLTTCTRTESNKGFWKNAFGMRPVGSIGKAVRYEWVLRMNKTRNRDWEDELVDSVIIGVIDATGIKANMGSTFTEYNDGWGVVGDGYKVTDGMYERFSVRYMHADQVKVALQWIPIGNDEERCQFLCNDAVAYSLDAQRKYKLAIAMNSSEYAVEWVSFTKYDDVI